MRFNRELLAIALLLLVFVIVGALVGGHGEAKSRQVGPEEYPDPSVYNDRASGSKGCFEWVRALGYQPVVWRRSWDALGQSPARVLLVIAPRAEASFSPLTGDDETGGGARRDKTLLSADDADALRRWLSQGHTAVLMASRLPTARVAGSRRGAPSFADALDMAAETAATGGRTEFSPLQPVPQTQGVLSVHSASDARLRRAAPDALCLFGDKSGPLALTLPVGKGRLIAIADDRFASNSDLPRSENAVFLAHLLTEGGAPGGTVLFDEYHHGDVLLENGGSVWAALGRPLQLALLQLALAGLLAAAVAAVRFGLPVPLGRGQTRTSTEYVASLAGLYQRAHASPAALETLYRQFLRDLSARLALSPDVNLEQLAEAAARGGAVRKDALRRLLATCEQRLDSGSITEPELLDLTRQMEAVRKDLGLA